MALPFGTIVAICAIWTLITVPLTVVGGIVGKNTKSDFNAPCRTGKYPREIPTLPWYRGTPAQMAIAGLLPFSAIYIELFYVFSSLWGHKVGRGVGVCRTIVLVLAAVKPWFPSAPEHALSGVPLGTLNAFLFLNARSVVWC